jgi:uncharacterized protein YabN with tetrapyrrole methylase and pyrophosphatase domain
MACIHTLEKNVLGWAADRGILANSTASQQFLKLVSEMGELADNIAKGRDTRDDIGDCMVVLTIIANLMGTDLHECLSTAWDVFKDRKGYLNDSGVFIKESDNPQLSLVV